MLYLEVLPACILYSLALGSATLLARLTRVGQPLFPYLWRALVASLAGIPIANALLWAIVVSAGSILNATNAPDQLRQVVRMLNPLGPILQPLPASLIGAIAGIIVGFAWARRSGHPKA